MEKTRILVVEDEEIVAADLRSTLRKFGYDVIASVSSGEEALAQVATYQPDLVLMDIILKGKMDGVEAAEQIRTKYNIPVIYLTAYSDETTLHRAKITSPYGYILKPFDNHELAIIVELALYKSLMDSKLRQSEARFQAFMNNSPAASWIMDNEGKMIYLSQPYGRITGIDIEKAIGKSAFELYPTEIAEGLMATVRQVDETGQTIEVVEAFPRPDGTIGFTLSYKFPLPDSGQHLIGGVSMDITERKQEEETLRLLSEAGKLLVSSLDYKSLLQNIAHLLVPTLADWCVIDAIDLEAEDTHSGKLSRLVTVYADPTKEALATEL
ncbi:MAG: response regulator, partial [Chloroflexota bacterium]